MSRTWCRSTKKVIAGTTAGMAAARGEPNTATENIITRGTAKTKLGEEEAMASAPITFSPRTWNVSTVVAERKIYIEREIERERLCVCARVVCVRIRVVWRLRWGGSAKCGVHIVLAICLLHVGSTKCPVHIHVHLSHAAVIL